MTLPLTGPLSFADVNLELSKASTAQISLDDSDVRTLFGVFNGQIGFGNGVGATYSAAGFSWGLKTMREGIRDITYNGSVYVAVGDYNGIWTATNVNGPWSLRSTLSTSSLDAFNSVAWSGSVFAAVGSSNSIWTSPDGINWTSRNSGSGTNYGVEYVLGQFIVVGSTGSILTSSDNGVTWSSRTSGTTQNLTSLASNGTIAVIVGSSGTALSSTDGVTWTARSTGNTSNISDVTYGSGKFMAVSESPRNIYYSSDGITWSTGATGVGNPINKIAFGAGLFMIGSSNNNIYSTTDGITLTQRGVPNTNINASNVAYLNGQFLNFYGFIMNTSSDGLTWTQVSDIQTIQGLSYAGGTYVYVSLGPTTGPSTPLIKSSTDGTTWTARSSGSGFNSGFYDVTNNNGLFAACGPSGRIFTSPDGITWTSRTSGTSFALRCIAPSGASGFIATGVGGAVVYSTDGITWSSSTSNTSNTIYGCAYNGSNEWIFVAAQGTVRTSSDLATGWFDRPTSAYYASTIFYSVAYSPTLSLYVIVGDTGKILTYSGGNFQGRASGVTTDLYRVVWANNMFIATGASGVVLASRDGINWSSRTTNSRGAHYATIWDGSKFITGGTTGRRLESPIPATDPLL